MIKVSQVAIQVHSHKIEAKSGVAYQNRSEYLRMFISDWLRARKLQLGDFNRFVFQEFLEPVRDLKVVGEKAFAVGVSLEYPDVVLETAEDVHRYFVRKYLEGFKRVDAHFNLQLTAELREAIDREYASGEYFYEKKLAGKRIDGKSVQLFDHYTHEEYTLIMRTKVGSQVEERVLFRFEPDVFRVKYRIKKCEISPEGVRVLNSVGKETLYYAFGSD